VIVTYLAQRQYSRVEKTDPARGEMRNEKCRPVEELGMAETQRCLSM